ncbi:hypothetical protein HGRIS_009779 [Hohenbuehelia grisea]|uniref:Uncharacterized protein n=1 Tax=Hohenbuehelia grisea TaxID=104357 RepID=A0ABR3J2Q3_9AGAR
MFSSLSTRNQRNIDHAFDVVASKPKPHPGSSSEVNNASQSEGGGFSNDSSGGGFIIDDNDTPSLTSTSIPYSSVPDALQILDLPPDDGQILSVFRNAADEGVISREDWRSVCAVLLEGDDGDEGEPMDVDVVGSNGTRPPKRPYVESDDEGGSDEYREDPSSDSEQDIIDEDSGDEYTEGLPKQKPPSRRNTRVRAKTRNKSASLSRSQSPITNAHTKRPTARQEKVILETYALFFPSLQPDSPELPKQRLMLKDLQLAAKLLHENLKAQEMLEMLETFSTSPDKSMSLTDFGKMMIMAKLA